MSDLHDWVSEIDAYPDASAWDWLDRARDSIRHRASITEPDLKCGRECVVKFGARIGRRVTLGDCVTVCEGADIHAGVTIPDRACVPEYVTVSDSADLCIIDGWTFIIDSENNAQILARRVGRRIDAECEPHFETAAVWTKALRWAANLDREECAA